MEIKLILVIGSVISILIGVILHEMMHAYVAYLFGDDTSRTRSRITLNPFAHIHPVYTFLLPLVLLVFGQPPIGAAKPVAISSERLRGGDWGLAWVGLAGPLTNLALALVGSFLIQFFVDGNLIYDFFKIFITFNVVFFVFNMLPIPPLDGSRLLYVFAPDSVRAFMTSIERMGIIFIIMIILIDNASLRIIPTILINSINFMTDLFL